METQEPKYSVCWKCHWLIADPGGFFKREKKSGPCDKCLGKMTIFQQAWEKDIWLRFIPPREEKKQRPIEPNAQTNKEKPEEK